MTFNAVSVRILITVSGVIFSQFAPGAERGAPCPPARAGERPWLDTSMSAECRADLLLGTLVGIDAKLEALGGGLQRFGVTEASGPDGPAGPTRSPRPPVSPPNALTVAASFDVELASRYGTLVGQEFRAAGMRGMLGPTLDVARTWRHGRVSESYGEDPLLTSVLGSAVVKATQQQGVAVTLKHYAGYTQEQGRTGDLPFGLNPAVDNVVSERVMREIYLPPFRAAVEQADALGVMCAFPRINGTYACENPWLLGILKNEWGFRGTVGPDFPDAQRTVVEAVNAGLDSGNFGLPRAFPPPSPNPPATPPPGGAPDLGAALGGGGVPGGITLKQALLEGRVKESRLDDMIRRRLVRAFALDGVSPPARELASPATLEEALRVAESGAVLLRNERNLLPLNARIRSIAVIGAQAGSDPQVVTPGSAFIAAIHGKPLLEEMRRRAGSATVGYAQGSLKLGALPLMDPTVLRTPEGTPGLRAEYFANAALDFSGPVLRSVIDARIDQHGVTPVPNLPSNNLWSVRWTGTLVPRANGTHTFSIAGAGSARLYLDDRRVAHYDRVDFGTVAYATAKLVAGKPVRIRVEYTPRESAPIPAMNMLGVTLGAKMQLGWSEPDSRIAEAVALARRSDVAVIFAADNYGEGADRVSLGLPAGLDQLISAVAAVNPRTVVVLTTSGPVSMPWVNKVGAVLQMWYPGDAFATAATRLLFGDAQPGGRLPITFPAGEGQGPASLPRNYPGTVAANGALDKAYFDEGLLAGYRWYDAKGQKPLFPFGHGLGYSRIEIADVRLVTGPDVAVTATLRNTGASAAIDVVQVYLAFPASAGEPPKRLAAFAKFEIAPGAEREARIAIPRNAFEIWDEARRLWVVPAGVYTVLVGRSSRDIVHRESFTQSAY